MPRPCLAAAEPSREPGRLDHGGSPVTSTRPDRLRRVLAAVAIGGGLGRLRPAPGTWGSAATAAVIWAGWGRLSFWAWAAASTVALWIGRSAVASYTADRGQHDPSEVVVDEVAGMLAAAAVLTAGRALPALVVPATRASGPAAFFATPFGSVLLLFLLFRLFDIAKPGPIGWIDRKMPTPAGVMLDDVLAGIVTGVAAIGILAAFA